MKMFSTAEQQHLRREHLNNWQASDSSVSQFASLCDMLVQEDLFICNTTFEMLTYDIGLTFEHERINQQSIIYIYIQF